MEQAAWQTVQWLLKPTSNSGRSPALALHAFRSRWAHRGVLCRVREGAGDGQPTLQLRFTLAHPCPPLSPASALAVLPELPPVQEGGPTA